MTALVVVLTLVVALQTILLVGLLRGHAEVLRRLHELGAGLDPDGAATGATIASGAGGVVTADGLPLPTPTRTGIEPQLGPLAPAEGRRAHDLSGLTPREEAVGLRVVDVEHDTLLVFLSSTCSGCAPYWTELADPDVDDDTRVVIVTREEPDEDLDAIRRLAPAGATVVMSSGAYEDHEVPGSPYVIHVEGRTGRIRGEGTAGSWAAVRQLLLRGTAQRRPPRNRAAVDRRVDRGADRGQQLRGKAAADERRERDADRHLLAAGISPGDPSLYVRADGTPVEPPHLAAEPVVPTVDPAADPVVGTSREST